MDTAAIAHFRARLAFETDPADVFRDQAVDAPFVLVEDDEGPVAFARDPLVNVVGAARCAC